MKTLILAVILGLALSGCATQKEAQLTYLGAYPTDCANKIKHQKYLQTLLNGDRQNDALIKQKIWFLESQCEDVKPR